MTKTEHYQLNQWDAADPIRREDFNGDNAKIDAALAAQVVQITGGLAEISAANRVVKLAQASLTEQSSSVTLSLSGQDMARFQALKLYVEGAAASQGDGVFCIVNHDSSAAYLPGSGGTVQSWVQLGSAPYCFYGVGGCECRIFSNGQHLCFVSTDYHADNSGGAAYSLNYGLYKNHTLADVTSLTLFTNTYPFLPGLRAALYGILK